jgi:hypothetical protein
VRGEHDTILQPSCRSGAWLSRWSRRGRASGRLHLRDVVAARQLRSTVNYGHRSTLLSCTELQERCGGPRQGPELPRCFAAQRPVGDHTPMEKVDGGYLVTASLPETDALADRFADKWVRERLRELASVGVDQPKVTHLGTDRESRAPCRCRKRPSDPVYHLSQRRTAAAVRHMFWPNRPLQGARHQRSRESPGRPTRGLR